MADAGWALGISPKTVHSRLRKGLLVAHMQNGRLLVQVPSDAAVGPPPEATLGAADVAARVGVGVGKVRAMADAGELAVFRRGRVRWFRPADVEEFLARRRIVPGELSGSHHQPGC